MANSVSYASIFTKLVDGVVQQRSTTQILEARNELVRYNGGKDIKIAKIALSGLANYDRGNGWRAGSVDLDWETKTFTQDRGRKFTIDVMDEDESNFVLTSGLVLSEFTRTKTVPEVDAYRLSKIAKQAYTKGATNYEASVTISKTNALEKLLAGIGFAQNKGYASEELVAFVAFPVYNLLINSPDLAKRLDVGYRTTADGVEMRFYSLNGVEIIPVQSDRMKSGYTFNAGSADTVEDGGFTPLLSAIDVNFLIVPKPSALAIVKHVVSKVIPPELNQTSDGYIVALRVYHDIFFPDNASVGIFASFADAVTADIFTA